MNKRESTITQANVKALTTASMELGKLYNLTKKYPSTKDSLIKANGFFILLRDFYLTHLGPMEETVTTFPYTALEVRKIFNQAKNIYNYARNNTNKKQTEKLFTTIQKVFDLAIKRAEWNETNNAIPF